MKLASGTQLGSYDVLGALGAGGMGEVYRARDTKLDRDVALKILPEEFFEDRDRVARFEREAKALAALNHPGIAAVYSFEAVDGRHILVMELVEGEGLDARIARGAIPLDEALPIARQIAEALEAAHEKGIVHRDLKPANVMVSSQGKVKVLDFGLAKALEEDAGTRSGSGLTQSPTITARATQAGVVLGTAAYMSPEQARGKSVDKRADVWAFGAVLYEMLTGRKAFEGETISDTLAAVLRAEPEWSRLPAETSSNVRRVLRRCLERDRERRLRDIGDARLELEDTRDEAPEPQPYPRPGHRSDRRRKALLLAGLLLLGAVTGGLATRALRPGADVAPRFALRRLTELPGPELHPDLSPDGRSLVYTSAAGGNRDLYLLRVGGDRAVNLTAGSSADDEQAAISPDGETIAFRSGRDGGGLFLMGLTGESVRRLTTAGYEPAWSPDGRFLAYATEPVRDPYSRESISELWTVEVATGKRARLLPGDAVQPTWSPRGDRIAYWVNTEGQRDIWTVPAGGGKPVPVTEDAPTDWSPEWSPDGEWLYFSSDRGGSMDLWRIAIDAASGRGRSEPERVTSGVRSLGAARFSADGRRLTVMAYDRTVDLTLFEVSTEGKTTLRQLATLRPQSAHWCAPSPDARWLSCATTGTPEDLVLLRSDASELRRLTNDAHKDRLASWSPDGETIAFMSTRGGAWNHWGIRPDGSGLRQLTAFGEVGPATWAPSGQEMIVGAHYKDLWRVDTSRLADARTARRLTPPKEAPRFEPIAWSPKGNRLAGGEPDEEHAGETRTLGVWDLTAGTYRRLDVPPAGRNFGAIAGWLADGRHFIARSRDGIALVDADTGTWRVIGPCARFDYLRATPDGRVLLVEHEVTDSDVWMLELQ